MASGALVSLVAYGAQDVYLTGNPQITHFKVVYRRHTNFALETIALPMEGGCQFGARSHVRVTRNGDLISNVYFMVTVHAVRPSAGSKFAWIKRLGHALIKSVEVDIGGSCIDKQYGTWMNIWYDLAHHAGDGERGFAKMIGDVPELTNYNGENKCEYKMYIPLQFWFNRHYGLALPLIALQYHEVRVQFEISRVEDVIVANQCFKNRDMAQVRLKTCELLVKYVFLDSEERRRFAQVGHEYLIEQLQDTVEGVTGATNKYRLDFNHPTKELIWAMKNGNYSTGKAFPYYTDDWTNPCVFEDAAKKILSESLMLVECCGDETEAANDCDACEDPTVQPCVDPNNACDDQKQWEVFLPGSDDARKTSDCKITVTNKSTKCLWVNRSSLVIDSSKIKCNGADSLNNLTGKICASIHVDECCNIFICDVESDLTIRDLSYPVESLRDTRNADMVDDPFVNQCNWGTLIDGSVNPVDIAQLQVNGHDREEKREGDYFNYLQPDQHHTNTPADGINVYSFALYPELHQPSGTTNLSRIDNTQLCVWFRDKTRGCDNELPELPLFNAENTLHVWGVSYNILRVMSGMAGLAYSN